MVDYYPAFTCSNDGPVSCAGRSSCCVLLLRAFERHADGLFEVWSLTFQSGFLFDFLLQWCDKISYDAIPYGMVKYWCDALWSSMTWYDAIQCSRTCTLWYGTLRHNTIQYDALLYDTIQYAMIQYDMLWYNTVWCDTIQYSIIWYGMIWETVQCVRVWYDKVGYNTRRLAETGQSSSQRFFCLVYLTCYPGSW